MKVSKESNNNCMVFFENALENAFIDKELKSIKGIDIQKEQSNSREEKAEKSRK